MKKPQIQRNQWTRRHGSLQLDTNTGSWGTYRRGNYFHPTGVVAVYTDSVHTMIETSVNGTHYTQSRRDNPTDRQISNFCRNLLKSIQE